MTGHERIEQERAVKDRRERTGREMTEQERGR